MPDQPCPNTARHTPAPASYLGWHAWAEKMSATHQQKRCDGCGLYTIWEPFTPGARLVPPGNHTHVCIKVEKAHWP